MSRVDMAKRAIASVLQQLESAAQALDVNDIHAARNLVYAARFDLGSVKTTLDEELRMRALVSEGSETERLKRVRIGGRP